MFLGGFMKTTRVLQCCVGLSLIVALPAISQAAKCSGYDSEVVESVNVTELSKGHSVTIVRSYSLLTSENSIYTLGTGECSAVVLATPDGATRASGHCVWKDKDGDTYSNRFEQEAGADKTKWKTVGGTGKYANKSGSGWVQPVRDDGKMSVFKWEGECN
jgi:hypothetical protein